tara:strand:- start:101 stop:592 length:492 start_codon:yes stop_codon:yes gene_type:complete
MGKVIIILFCTTFLFSCKKDKVPIPCTGISMSGDRSVFVGKWRWYKTRVSEWFDIGPDISYEYTPQNQGFNYYFTVSQDGLFKGYRNDTLVHDIILSSVYQELFLGGGVDGMEVFENCSSKIIRFSRYTPSSTLDSIHLFQYPFNFYDEINQMKSNQNYFVRE